MSETTARRKAALWVGAVFVLGAALGGVLGYIFAHHSVSADVAAKLPATEAERRARRLEQITKEVGLTTEQREHLNKVLDQLHAEYKTIRRQSEAQTDQARQKTRDEIRAFLTPEQKPKFEEFVKRLDEERKRNAPPEPR